MKHSLMHSFLIRFQSKIIFFPAGKKRSIEYLNVMRGMNQIFAVGNQKTRQAHGIGSPADRSSNRKPASALFIFLLRRFQPFPGFRQLLSSARLWRDFQRC